MHHYFNPNPAGLFSGSFFDDGGAGGGGKSPAT